MKLRHLLPALLVAVGLGAAPILLDECATVADWTGARPPTAVAAVDSPFPGQQAVQVTMPGMVTRQLTRTQVPGSAAWDGYAGVSFWVKGDGSDQYGCLALVGPYPFVTYFPLANQEWHQLVVPWHDFVPESQVDPIGSYGGMPPSGIQAIRLGSRWTIGHNNAPIPEHRYAVSRIELVEELPAPPPVPAARSFGEVLALLKAKQPVRIQCMGDSITAGTGLADRDRERYATQTQDLLRRWLGYEVILCYSHAVGGAKLTDARAWIPRDFAGTTPDLVTVWYGYNDKSNAFTRESYAKSLNDYLDRVQRVTGGRAAILLFATGPGCGPRFTMLDDYAETVRETARQRGLPCFDIHAILKAIGREELNEFFGDLAHPNARGHELIADHLATFLVEAADIDLPKPVPPPRPAAGPAQAWDFKDGAKDWNLDCDEVTCTADAAGRMSLRFALGEDGKDHRRAYSPLYPVEPRQLYTVSAQIWGERPLATGSMGVYACLYDNPEGQGEPKIVAIQRGFVGTGQWEAKSDRLEIPDGVRSLRIMIWGSRDATGEFRCADVAIQPGE